jgi:peptide deformylase
MAMLEIRKFNDPILRKKGKKIIKIDQEIKQLAKDMEETMKEGNGIGLAAPQIGVSKKIITVETDYRNRKVLAFINPKIVKKSRKKAVDTEGCLSFPGIYIEIKRAEEVEVKAKDINGRKIRLKASGLLARTFQHEIDHINGIVFYQRLNPIKRIAFKRKHQLK